MGKKKKYYIGFALFLLFAVAWSIRVVTYNKQLIQMKGSYEVNGGVKKYDTIGEWVECGDNYIGDSYSKGYSIKVENVSVFTAKEYEKKLNDIGYYESLNYASMPLQQVCEVEVTIKNESSQESEESDQVGVDFLETYLLGEDFFNSLQTEWFAAVNSFEPSSMGKVRLRVGEECTLKLPYGFIGVLYRDKFGRSLDKEKLWIRWTSYPEKRWVRAQ